MKINTDVQFAIMAKELKSLKKKDHKYKSKASSSKSYYSGSEVEKPEKNSLRATDHYQPAPYHHPKKNRKPKEIRIVFPHFNGTNNIDTFLDWEMKVEQLFECYNVSEERKVDENQELKFNQPQAPAQINNLNDALQIPSGPITRSRAV